MSTSSTEIYETVTARMVELLEAGTVPWRKPWSAVNGPRNIEGRPYRGINVFLLSTAGYDSPFWLTFKQARERGGSVRKGEKSTLVVFWKILQGTDRLTGEDKKVPLLRYFRVFNLEQTDGVKLPKAVQDYEPTEHEPLVSAEDIVAGYADGPTISETSTSATYSPGEDAIRVPARGAFEDIEEFYSTLFHEIGHSTGHKSRLDRWSKGHSHEFGGHAYGREELVAEMTAAFLGAEAGITSTQNNSAAYLASWISTIKADPKAVVTAAGAAQKAADRVLGRTFATVSTTEQKVGNKA